MHGQAHQLSGSDRAALPARTEHRDRRDCVGDSAAWTDTRQNVERVLATAGGLVFYGRPNGGFAAVDQRNGKTLWEFPTKFV